MNTRPTEVEREVLLRAYKGRGSSEQIERGIPTNVLAGGSRE